MDEQMAWLCRGYGMAILYLEEKFPLWALFCVIGFFIEQEIFFLWE